MKKTVFGIMALSFLNMSLASPNIKIEQAWERISNPLIMSTSFNYKFFELPLSGKVSDPQKYWSSDYWARYKGGINYRWNSPSPSGFNLDSPNRTQAMVMSLSELAALAPSEKLDILNARYDYPIKKEINSYASPNRPTWEGICDGWAGAALNHNEPRPVTVANSDGIQVPFGSSDIKALLSWYYAKKHSGGYAMMGRRCNSRISVSVDRCNQDMNAGAFHMVLTNRLGVEGKSFVADIDRYAEVWNHLAWDYKSTIINSNLQPAVSSAPGTVRRVKLKTVVSYVWLLARNTWTPVLGTRLQHVHTRTYTYDLDLNAKNEIIGGEWLSKTRPDFLWLERKASRFTGLYSKISMLIDDALDEDGEVIEDEGSNIDSEVTSEMEEGLAIN